MSIASRITSIEEHIGNAYNKLEDLGIDLTNVDKNIENIVEMLDTVYEDYPKVQGQGTEVTLDGTKVGKLSLDVKGNSTQETTQGYNLINLNSITQKTSAGVTYTPVFKNNKLEYITIVGTATATSFMDLYNNPSKQLISDTTKTYTFTVENTTINRQIYERIDGAWVNKYSASVEAVYRPFEGSTGQLFRILVTSGTTVNTKVYPMVYEGAYDNTKQYEPYTGRNS